MSVSQEIREYFSELIKPLATNEILGDMFKKLKEEISKFETKFAEQNRKIDELEGKLASKKIQLTCSLSDVMIMIDIADAVA